MSVESVLYGSRTTSWTWEVLTKDEALRGYLAGVAKGSLRWDANALHKGSGSVTVTDVHEPGMIALSDLDLVADRIRPVLHVDGLPDMPQGVFILAASPQSWDGTGMTADLELLDKTVVLEEDCVPDSFVAVTSTSVLWTVWDVVGSAGESMSFPFGGARLSSPSVWEAGTPKLTIVNDLLAAIAYQSLHTDERGNFVARSYVEPGDRPSDYPVLGIPRELVYGAESIYLPQWTRDNDNYKVPNRVVAVASSAETELSAEATNQNASSPFSYQARGRWVTRVLTGVDVAMPEEPEGLTDAELAAWQADARADQLATLQARARQSLIAASSPQAMVEVTHLPIPLRVGDVVRFAHPAAGIDARYVAQSIQLDCTPTGLMKTTLQEVIDL